MASAEETVVKVGALKLAAHEYPGGKEGSHVAAADCETNTSSETTSSVSTGIMFWVSSE